MGRTLGIWRSHYKMNGFSVDLGTILLILAFIFVFIDFFLLLLRRSRSSGSLTDSSFRKLSALRCAHSHSARLFSSRSRIFERRVCVEGSLLLQLFRFVASVQICRHLDRKWQFSALPLPPFRTPLCVVTLKTL
ncbi:MAG: hypothetical protein MW690_001704 [Methanophagales archaeon]|nr:hypothetical protein [Methanophagales archaeon]